MVNRAACNLELQNYGRVLSDCSKCLAINPQNVKALYRSAKALFALDRLIEAIDCCDHALVVDPENKAVEEVKEKAVNRKNMQEEKKRQKEEKERREREKKDILENAFKVYVRNRILYKRVISNIYFIIGKKNYYSSRR